jgi:hypothetical protein
VIQPNPVDGSGDYGCNKFYSAVMGAGSDRGLAPSSFAWANNNFSRHQRSPSIRAAILGCHSIFIFQRLTLSLSGRTSENGKSADPSMD